jgi:hypothetical protein
MSIPACRDRRSRSEESAYLSDNKLVFYILEMRYTSHCLRYPYLVFHRMRRSSVQHYVHRTSRSQLRYSQVQQKRRSREILVCVFCDVDETFHFLLLESTRARCQLPFMRFKSSRSKQAGHVTCAFCHISQLSCSRHDSHCFTMNCTSY